MTIITGGIGIINEAGKYTLATVEYSGLVSYSIVQKSCSASKRMFLRVAMPVVWSVSRPFVVVKSKVGKIFKKTGPDKEALRELEEKLIKIENRLAYIEKHGLTRISTTAVPQKEKNLSEERRSVLKEILKETKALREKE